MVTALLAGKKIFGTDEEILEIKNALSLYESIEQFDPGLKKDLFKAHKQLMNGLDKTAGKLRLVNVGVGNHQSLKYIAPVFKDVPDLIEHFFDKVKKPEFDEITMSALIHLEIESIHPFKDGNGRIGRFWQTLYLVKKVNPIFQYLNIEGLVKENQQLYYGALINSQSKKNSNYFVEFMLKIILESLKNYKKSQKNISNARSRVLSVKEFFKKREFTRIEYMKASGLSTTATASRDLAQAVDQKILTMSGEKNQSRYRFNV